MKDLTNIRYIPNVRIVGHDEKQQFLVALDVQLNEFSRVNIPAQSTHVPFSYAGDIGTMLETLNRAYANMSVIKVVVRRDKVFIYRNNEFVLSYLCADIDYLYRMIGRHIIGEINVPNDGSDTQAFLVKPEFLAERIPQE